MRQKLAIGDEVEGRQFYGRKNTLIGTVSNIEENSPLNHGDIITVSWDNGQVARFYKSDYYATLHNNAETLG